MTATLIPASPAAPSTRAVWAGVTDGLWAGTRDGEFVGTIEFVDGGFVTADHRGTRVGRSHSLAAAQRLLEGPVREPDVLSWGDERAVLATGWLGLGALAVAAVVLAVQLFA
jgi:hypothetical protein